MNALRLATILGTSLSLAVIAADAPARVSAGVANNRLVTAQAGYKYMVLLPEGYANRTNRARKYPMIIFLHGATKEEGLGKFKHFGPIQRGLSQTNFPFLVACPASARGWSLPALNQFLSYLQTSFRVDANRIYLTGHSMGAHATWMWAMAAPNRFAAIAPVSGAGNPEWAARLLPQLPVWIFHGMKDTVVPFSYGQAMATALEKAGGKVKTTFYPDRGHDVWDAPYREPGLYEWFWEQSRAGTPAMGMRKP